VKDAAWGCDWVGTPLPFTRCLSFVIKMASKEIKLTAGKFVPVSKATMMNVRYYFVFYKRTRKYPFLNQLDETSTVIAMARRIISVISHIILFQTKLRPSFNANYKKAVKRDSTS
jgi:hypothetical protein